MDLVHTVEDHDVVSQKVRLFAAQRLTELIESNRRHLDVAFADPDGMWDQEPTRIQAHVALAKLQATLIKELGSLYQVTRPPVRADDVAVMPVVEVERLLEEAQRRQDEAVGVAVAAAVAAVRLEVESRQRLELEVARSRVVESLALLRGDQG